MSAPIQSKTPQIGFKAPEFKLYDVVSGDSLSLETLMGDKGTVVMFLANHCPYVKHVQEEIVRVANDYQVIGFGFVAISSSDFEAYPEDAPQQMMKVARENDYSFPYLLDQSQAVAKAYAASCTPDFYVFDDALKMTYHGQLDDSRPQNNITLSGTSLRRALDTILSNGPPLKDQKPSVGCSIKWRKLSQNS